MNWMISVFAFIFTLFLPEAPAEEPLVIWEGKMARITVDKSLYESELSSHFFLKYTLHNKTSDPLGVDFSDEDRIFHPNQWGVHSEPHRLVIDERILTPMTRKRLLKKRLKACWGKSDLVLIPPGGSIDYYRDFNASDKSEIKGTSGEYLIVSNDGELFFFDEKHYELASRISENMRETDLALPFPLVFSPIPDGAKVLLDM
jgi:hypothetical protein